MKNIDKIEQVPQTNNGESMKEYVFVKRIKNSNGPDHWEMYKWFYKNEQINGYTVSTKVGEKDLGKITEEEAKLLPQW